VKDGAQEILGKTISGIAIRHGKGRQPASQLFITFADGTYFEFYSDGVIVPSGGADAGTLDDVRRYLSEITDVVFETYPRRGF